QSVRGTEIVEKFRMNRRYQPAVPKNLLTCLTFFGIGICTIACTFSGSVLSAPSPTMYPRYF
ncbi:blast:Retrovirus-related Pol polyprotein from transposon gypsy, partial [Drosophila guanche]